MSTLRVTTIQDASGGNTATINSMTPTADSLQGFRNRIINGDMRIDQRNAGASVTPADGVTTYTLDRWHYRRDGAGVATVQQSSTAPTGFVNSSLITVTTADSSLAAGDQYNFTQFIEGTNVSDLAWGTASAKTVTLSFWVRSSLTGTFAGGLSNSAGDRSYVFTYAISAANTWEQKTVTVAGDTSGTWLTTTGIGLRVIFDLGVGSDRQTTAGSWTGSYRYATSGSVKTISTLSATWYITGVQLEVGSVATPFERRPYGTELALCQRYYDKSYPQTVQPGTGTNFIGSCLALAYDTSNLGVQGMRWKQTMRATPTVTVYHQNGTANAVYYIPTAGVITVTGAQYMADSGCWNVASSAAFVSGGAYYFHYTASAEL